MTLMMGNAVNLKIIVVFSISNFVIDGLVTAMVNAMLLCDVRETVVVDKIIVQIFARKL